MKRKFNRSMGTIQTTLDGMKLRFPKVRTSDGHMLEWDREAIVKQLLRETKLSGEFYGSSPIGEDTAREIAKEAEKRIKVMGISQLSGALVREIVNQILLEEHHHQEWRNVCTRVGTPVYDAHLIDIGEGFEANENANLQENAESLPCDEKILIKLGKEISVKPIGEIVDRILEKAKKEGKIYRNGRSEIVFNEGYNVKAFSFDDNFTVSEVPITQFIRNEPADIYEVSTSYGKKVRVTAGHNFFCLKNGEVRSKPLSELKVGDSILIPRRIRRNGCTGFLNGYKILIKNLTLDEMKEFFIVGEPLRDLVRENEEITRERDKNNGTKNYRKCVENCGLPLDILFEINYEPTLDELKQLRVVSWHGFKDTPKIPLYYENTAELGEWLGLILSEGSYSEPNKITFANNDDSLHERFAELSKEIFGITPRMESNCSIISKSVIAIKSLFLLHGTRSNKSVPFFMYNAPEECISGFIRGYHAGDGSKSEMKMTTTSEEILEFLRYAFLVLGFIPSIYISNRNNPRWSTSYDIGINSITKFYDLAKGGIGNYNYECGDLISFIINEIGGVTGGKESVQLWDYGNARRGKSLSRGTIERFINDAKERIDNRAEYIIMKEYGKSPFTPKDISELLNISIKAAYEYVKRLCGRGLCEKTEKSTKYEHSIGYDYTLTDKIFNKYEKVFKSLEILSKLINGDVTFCKIKESKKVGREVTYDIATDTNTQNFIAGDGFLFVHNTSHKKKADKICKEQYLLLLPPKLADAHLSGDLHIHDLEYFGTRGFCFPADEPVVLNNPGSVIVDGIERVMDSAVFIEKNQGWEVYKPGKPIEIQTEEKFEPIKKIYRRKYSGKILCLKTIGGYQIRVTPDHVIPTDKGFKRANELEVGDCLEISKDVQLPDKNEIDLLELIKDDSVWYVKQEIDAGDYGYEKMSKKLNVPYNTVYYWFSHCSFPLLALRQLNIEIKKDAKLRYTRYARKWIPRFLPFNYNLGLFFGLLISEGHYTKEGKEIGITNKNRNILTKFSSIADEILGIVPVVKNSSTPQAIIRSKTVNKLFSDLLDIGCSSEVKQIPGKLYSKREDYLLGLLNGLFSGDGGARIKKDRGAYLSYSTQSPVLQKQVLLLLRALGINASVAEYERDNREFSDKYVIIGHPAEQKKLMDAGFKMIDEEKNRVFNEMCEMEKAENQYSEERKGIVKSIKSYDYDGYVYDLTIDNERHLFSNADGIVVHNCQDWDLRYFFYYGLMPDGSGTKASVAGPAKKPEVAILHAVKILGSAQTNFAGGQGFFNFLTFIAPYLEGLPYDEIEQLMQMFVYEMTQMQVARGGQLVFSSVQLTPGVPKIWKDKPVVYKGQVWNGEQASLRTYGEFEREARLAFKALMNVMLQGDYWGKPFNFPKPEVAIEPDFLKEDAEFNKNNPNLPTYEELYDLAFELTAKYGTPYFDNKIPEYRGAGEGVSCYQCLDKDELIPIIENGNVKVDYISNIFEKGAVDGIRADGGVEFVKLNAMTPSMEFGRFRVSPQPFKGIMRRKYRGTLLNIILESGRRIRVTLDHPLFVYRSGGFERIVASKLSTSDYLPVMKHAGFESTPVRSIDLEDVLVAGGFDSEITVKDEMVNILHAKKPGFPKTLRITPEFVRFLGYYLSEGCSDHSGRRYSVRLSFGKDEADLINDAKRCISIGLGIEPTISIESTAVNVTTNSKLLYLLLEALGCGHTANDKSVPDLLFNVEPPLVREYLYGVFAGDGNVDSHVNTLKNEYGEYESHANVIRLKLVSKSAVQKLVLLAQRINVQMNYYERIQKTTHPQTKEVYFLPTFIASITAQDQIQKFSDVVGYGSSAIHNGGMNTAGAFTRIPIKESGLSYSNLIYATQYHSGGYARINQSLIDTDGSGIVHDLVKSDIHVLRVKKIEEIDYDDYVYDLVDVEDTHNFCNALGIITGNCCAYSFKTSADDEELQDKMYFRNGKHFSMGGWQVITINCPRAAYRADGDDEKLLAELRRLMDLAVEVLKEKRRWMEKIVESGRMPFATQRPKDPHTGEKGDVAVYLDELVYIIGVVGINEMVQYHYGKQMHEDKGALRLAIRVMTEMELYAKELSQREDMKISFARTPAESLPGDEWVWIKDEWGIKREKIGEIVDRYMELFADKIEIRNGSEILDLDNLNIDLKTVAFNEEYKIGEAKITKLIRHGSNEIYKIRTSHGIIRTTPCHSVFTADEEGFPTQIEVLRLKIGDYIATPNSIDIPVNEHPIELYENMKYLDNLYIAGNREILEELYNFSSRCKDWILLNRKTSIKDMKSSWLNNELLPVKLILDCDIPIPKEEALSLKIAKSESKWPLYIIKDVKLGTLLGYLISEGTLYNNERKRIAQIANNDINIIRECGEIFKSYNINTAISMDAKGTYKLQTSNAGYDFVAWGLQAIDILGKKKIPCWLFDAPLDVVVAFIKAYNKGDGSVYCNENKRDRYFRISTIEEDFANDISFLLRRFGVAPRMVVRERDNCSSGKEYTINASGRDDLNRLKELGFDVETGQRDTSDMLPNAKNMVYKLKEDLGLTRRKFVEVFECSEWMLNIYYQDNQLTRAKLKHLVEVGHRKGIKSKYLDKIKKLVDSDISYGKVLSIDKEGVVEHTYDFEVRPMENFLAGIGCVIAHNTTAQRFAVADLLNKECRDKATKVVKGDLEKALSRINETRDLPIYYTNGTHVPPNADISLAERIKLEHVFFPIVDGGDIMHIFLGEGYPDPGGLKSLAMKIARNTQTGYYAFTKDMTVCMDCSHVAMGLKEDCEKCGSKNLDYISRITGYLQAVSGWNEGKKQELLDRVRYGKDEIK